MTQDYIPKSSTVYTPAQLAGGMVRAARGNTQMFWLDPCVGDGAFVAEMARIGVQRQHITALDISVNQGQTDHLAQTIRGVDFLKWAEGKIGLFDRVVMNPPFVPIGRLRGQPLHNALRVTPTAGTPLTRRSNYWCAFLIRAVSCLRDGGSLVAVLPAAWDYAKYAADVRNEIVREFGEVTVVRCLTPLFPKVKDGCVVVVCHRRGETRCRYRRIETVDLADTVRALDGIAEGRMDSSRSTIHLGAGVRYQDVPLGTVLDIRIGAVTGDSSFFLLSEKDRRELGLPIRSVRPVLSRSSHLTTAVMDRSAWLSLHKSGARIWLFRPSKASLAHPAVREYLRCGIEGACNTDGFKVRSRDPWYLTPLPGRSDGFVSGMSKRLPHLILSGMPGLTATNTLYVCRFKKKITAAEKAALGLVMLTSRVRLALRERARVYPDGLLKFEPNDLSKVRVPLPRPSDDSHILFMKATTLLLAGDEKAASAIADNWLSGVSGARSPGSADVLLRHGSRGADIA